MTMDIYKKNLTLQNIKIVLSFLTLTYLEYNNDRLFFLFLSNSLCNVEDMH